MAVYELDDADFVECFARSTDQRRRGRWMLLGGIGMFGVGVVGFTIALFSDVDQLTLHSMSTAPILIALGLLTGGWSLTRGATCVTLDERGLEIEGADGSVLHRWDDVGWSTVGAKALSHQRELVVYDRDGRQIAKLSEVFENFDDLIAGVKRRVDDGPQTVASSIQLRKARKSALIMASFSVIMLAVCGSIAWMTYEDQRAARLLETDAVVGEAAMNRMIVAPNGFTTRVDYTVTNASGETGTRNAEIEPEYHAMLTETAATTIPVKYVEAEPSISRLVEGEVIDDDFMNTPLGGYGLAGLVSLMCLFFLGASVMQWFGWDIDLDSKTGKLSITRFGEGT